MTFVPENELERALMRAATEPGARSQFYRLLLESELFVLGRTKDQTSAMPGAQDTGVMLQIVQIRHKDRLYHPIFSSLARMQNYLNDHPDYFTIKARDLFVSTLGAYLLLNPGSDYGKELLPQEIAELLQPRTMAPQESVPLESLISEPAIYPQEIVMRLTALFEQHPEVEAAYLAQMALAATGQPPHAVIGVKMVGPWEPFAEEIGRVLGERLQRTRVDAFRIVESGLGKQVSDALKRYPPFYVRQNSKH